MIKNYDESVEINCNSNWPSFPDNPYRISLIGGSGSGKTNVLLNIIKHEFSNQSIKYLSTGEKK